jgi:ribose/xylose/arabinose/galactoside ABC-type transport system permease subunit
LHERGGNMQNTTKKTKLKGNSIFSKIISFRFSGILFALFIICAVTGISNPKFFLKSNIFDMLRSVAYDSIIGIGMTYCLIAGGIDFSIGAVLCLTGILTAMVLQTGIPVWIGILIGLLVGIGCGLVNGTLIVYLRLPALIVTLGAMNIFNGIGYVATNATPVYPVPDAFKAIGQGNLGGLSYTIFIAIVLLFLADFTLKRTTFGRKIMAVGGNEETARLAGINVNVTKLCVYAIVSLTAGIYGMLLTSRLGSAQPNAGSNIAMTVIAAVVIGGTSMYGGYGSIWGTVIGVAIMNVLTYAMVLLGVSIYWQNVVIGVIMLGAIAMDTFRRIRAGGLK